MQFVIFCAALLISLSPACAQDVTVDRLNQSITPDMDVLTGHIGGRTDGRPLGSPFPQGSLSHRHQWPGVYFETAFIGDSLTLAFDDTANEYRLLIDAMPPISLAQPGRAQIIVQNLGQGQHKARLEKITESVWMPGSFDGFYAPSGGSSDTPAPRARQIEFIGDSDMTGYGIRSLTQTCTQEEVRLTSDTQIAFPALVAKHFDADYQINAISGRGMVRNYAGIAPDHTMFSVYPYIFPDEATPDAQVLYEAKNWAPQIVVIGLGDNDFATPLASAEGWPNTDALLDDYFATYDRFLTDLYIKNSNAALIIVGFSPTILSDLERLKFTADAQTRLTAKARQLGFRSIDFMDMTSLAYDRAACDSHGSLADHKLRAEFVIDYITQHPQLWSKP